MRNLLLFTFLSVVLMSSSCDNTKPQVELSSDISLNFNANYDGELLLLEKEYAYEGDMPIKFSQFNFYIANIVLLKQNGSEFPGALVPLGFPASPLPAIIVALLSKPMMTRRSHLPPPRAPFSFMQIDVVGFASTVIE